MSTPEGFVIKACENYLDLFHIPYIRNNTGVARPRRKDGSEGFVRFGQVGSSDLIACLPGGIFLAIECKAEEGKLTSQQTEFLAKIRDSGGIALVVRSVDELHEGIKEAQKSRRGKK